MNCQETKGISYSLEHKATMLIISIYSKCVRITSPQYVRLCVHLQLYLGNFIIELSNISKSNGQQEKKNLVDMISIMYTVKMSKTFLNSEITNLKFPDIFRFSMTM